MTGYQFLINDAGQLSDAAAEAFWKLLSDQAKTEREQQTVISGLAKSQTSDWAIAIVENYMNTSDSGRVIDRAEKAADHIRDRQKVKEK